MPMTPIAGDRIVDSNDPLVIQHIIQTIRSMESGSNYTALNKTASASGAYQIIDGSWKSWSSGSGVAGATQYPRAYQAPKDIQDAVASWKVHGILIAYGGHLAAVPVIWFYPIAWNNEAILDSKPPGNPITVRDYAERWIKSYDKWVGFEGDAQTVPKNINGSSIPIVGGVIDAAGSIAAGIWQGVTSPLEVWQKLAEILTSPQLWMRVLKVIGGLISLAMGMWIITHDTGYMPKLPNAATVAMAAA